MRFTPLASRCAHCCPGKNLESVYMCLIETGICTVMRVLDSGLRMCREKVHAEAPPGPREARPEDKLQPRSNKNYHQEHEGHEEGSSGMVGFNPTTCARKTSLCALCSLW